MNTKCKKKLCLEWCRLNSWKNPKTGRKDKKPDYLKNSEMMSLIESVISKKTLLEFWNNKYLRKHKI